MECRRIELLIPLLVGGDLSETDAERARAHIQTCADCASLVSEYEASQQWFRQGEPDFDEEFLSGFKREVLQAIYKSRREPRHRWSLAGFFNNRLAIACSAAALLLIAILTFYSSRKSQEIGLDSEAQQAAIPAEESRDTNKTVDSSRANETRPAPEPVKPRKIYHARTKKAPAPRAQTTEIITSRVEYLKQDAAEDAASQEFIKTEIQTGDPKIRIIWLHPKETEPAQSNPLTEF